MNIYKFSTPDCTYCRAVDPHIKAYARNNGLEVIEVNADRETQNPLDKERTARHGIMGVPTVVFEDQGNVMAKAVGFPEIMKLLNKE